MFYFAPKFNAVLCPIISGVIRLCCKILNNDKFYCVTSHFSSSSRTVSYAMFVHMSLFQGLVNRVSKCKRKIGCVPIKVVETLRGWIYRCQHS